MKKLAVAIAAICCSTANAQQVQLDVWNSWDTDNVDTTTTTLSGWRYSPATISSQVMSWYTNTDIDYAFSRDGALRLVVAETDTPVAAAANMSRFSLADKSIRMRVRVSDWAQITSLTLVFGSDGDTLSDSATLDLKSKLINPQNGEWLDVIVPVADLERYGDIDLDNVNFVFLRAAGTAGATVDVERITAITAAPSAMITISIDDGHWTLPNALKLAEKHGVVGTLFIDPTVLGTDGFVDRAVIDGAAAKGWDIGGHHMGNLTYLSQEERDNKISAISADLELNQYQGRNLFAWPNGAEAKLNSGQFDTYFNIDGFSNPVGADTRKINRRSIDRWTTIAMVSDWIAEAEKNGTWLILNFHSFDQDTDESVSLGYFEAVLTMVNTRNVAILPASKVIDADLPQTTEVAIFDPRLKTGGDAIVNAADAGELINWGASVSYIKVSDDNFNISKHATDTRLLASYSREDWTVDGSIGALSMPNETKTVGNLRGTYYATPQLQIAAEYAITPVESISGLEFGMTIDTITLSADWNTQGGGVYAAVSSAEYDGASTNIAGIPLSIDDNRRTEFKTKAYVNVFDEVGGAVYFKGRHYTNSDPYNEIRYNDGTVATTEQWTEFWDKVPSLSPYFSPEEYTRTALGASFRTAVAPNWVLSGYVDSGPQWVDGDKENGWMARLQLETKPSKNWSAKVAIGADETEPGYRYNYMFGVLTYLF